MTLINTHLLPWLKKVMTDDELESRSRKILEIKYIIG